MLRKFVTHYDYFLVSLVIMFKNETASILLDILGNRNDGMINQIRCYGKYYLQ